MKHSFQTHDLVTEWSAQLLDLTDDARGAVEGAQIVNGTAVGGE